MNDIDYMKVAFENALIAYDNDEVPVGAIIVYQDKIIARAYNTNSRNNSPIEHAEINAIIKASKILESKYLSECTLYVTLEPCLMCLGAIMNARISRVCFGAFDLKNGAIISNQNAKDKKVINWTSGILKDECSSLIKDYFKNKREE